jgi:hypothetical protein
MNTDLMRQIADAIELFPDHFDMSSYYSDHGSACDCDDCCARGGVCDTTACIAGWAVILDQGERLTAARRTSLDWFAEGRHALGLTPDEADVLFVSYGNEWWLESYRALGIGIDYGYVEADAPRVARLLRGIADGAVSLPRT